MSPLRYSLVEVQRARSGPISITFLIYDCELDETILEITTHRARESLVPRGGRSIPFVDEDCEFLLREFVDSMEGQEYIRNRPRTRVSLVLTGDERSYEYDFTPFF